MVYSASKRFLRSVRLLPMSWPQSAPKACHLFSNRVNVPSPSRVMSFLNPRQRLRRSHSRMTFSFISWLAALPILWTCRLDRDGRAPFGIKSPSLFKFVLTRGLRDFGITPPPTYFLPAFTETSTNPFAHFWSPPYECFHLASISPKVFFMQSPRPSVIL